MSITSKQLQAQRITKVVKLAGPRYEKEVNIELPIRSLFHALIKSERFQESVMKMTLKLADSARYVGNEPFYGVSGSLYDQIKSRKSYVIKRLNSMTRGSAGHNIRERLIVQKLTELRDFTHELITALEEADKNEQIKVDPNSHTSTKSEINQLYELVRQVYEIISFFEGSNFSVFSSKSLLLQGEAGIGKTHLFCDFAKEAFKLGHPAYIFLGEEFAHDTNPLRRMSILLGGGTDYGSTFQKINDAAIKNNKRAIILIDAVNEAKLKVDWEKLTELKKYKNICFATSVRTGYERVVLTTGFLNRINTYHHPGLDIGRIEDITAFFTHFKVPVPEVPLIAPEFRNPLFIKIFCKTYSRKKTVRGKTGSTTLFEDYIRRQTRYVCRSANLPKAAQIWDPLIKPIAEWMGENGVDRILDSKAKELIELAFPGKSKDILTEMQRHWLLTRTPHYTKSGSVRGYEFKFPYQKFSDHLIVRYLINHHLDKALPEKSFLPNTKLGKIVISDRYYNPYYGLVEALAIQIPEHLKGRELADIAPNEFKESSVAGETFLNSLLWRSLAMKNDKLQYFSKPDVLRLINYYMSSDALTDGFDSVLETVLNAACIENHPIDASVLHSYLLKFNMPKRDAFWQKFVHYRYGEEGSIVDRYLHWSMSSLARKAKGQITPELTAIVLAWFLASSDRRIRDRSTKALVNLLDGKYSVIIKLLKRFNNVDDIYIIERLYAVAYGCALRESHPRNLKSLATYVYDTEFGGGSPKVHILIRDYAKGVVELYHRHDSSAPFDKCLYLPPYNSSFPARVPTEKTIEAKYSHSNDERKNYGSIRFSVEAGVGDFGRYVVESNLHKFTAIRLDGSTPPSEQDKLDELLKSLTPSQRKLVEKAGGGLPRPLIVQILRRPDGPPEYLEGFSPEKYNAARTASWETVLKSVGHLDSRQIDILKKYIDGKPIKNNKMFDAKRGSRWIIQRAIKLGWNPELHGEYDRSLGRYSNYGREPNKPERIGKKYQWQALHEFLARTADNYRISKDEGGSYQGVWQLSVRDIDPSCRITKAASTENKTTWWSVITYNNWRPDLPDRQWIAVDDDLPDFKRWIKCRDQKGKDWVNLNTHFGSDQEIPNVPRDQRYSHRRREIWATLKSYIIKKDDLGHFMNWVKDKNFEGLWMPESHNFYGIFYREYPYQPAFKHLYLPYYGRTDWHKRNKDIPVDLMVTDDEYSKENGGYDMSADEGYSISIPSKALYTGMDLRPSIRDGAYKGTGQEIVFYDPHIYQDGPASLLGSLTHIASYLDKNNYAMIWTVLGEKQMIGGSIGGRDRDWPGRLEFNGSYYLDTATLDIVGGLHLKHLNTRD